MSSSGVPNDAPSPPSPQGVKITVTANNDNVPQPSNMGRETTENEVERASIAKKKANQQSQPELPPEGAEIEEASPDFIAQTDES